MRTFLLVDSGAGLQRADLVAVEMLEEFNLPYVVSVYIALTLVLSFTIPYIANAK